MFGSIFSGRGLPQQQGMQIDPRIMQKQQGMQIDPRIMQMAFMQRGQRGLPQQQGMQGGLTIGQALMNRHRGM